MSPTDELTAATGRGCDELPGTELTVTANLAAATDTDVGPRDVQLPAQCRLQAARPIKPARHRPTARVMMGPFRFVRRADRPSWHCPSSVRDGRTPGGHAHGPVRRRTTG
ncbi:hypothetical protein GCM10022206_24900 [Streptomyces chiangmaiensis]